jgi:glycosyltransferase involved in cell wall biosynthesis
MNRQRIRIFVDAHVFDGPFQGSRTFIEGLYNQLTLKKDIELFIAAYDIESLKKFFPGSENVHFIRYKTTSRYFRLLFDIPFLVWKHKIDYAHFQYVVPLFKNCRFILTIHDMVFCELLNDYSFSYRFSKKKIYKFSASRADLITTVSEYSRNSIKRHLGTKTKPIHIITNGISEKFFEDYDKENAVTYISNKYDYRNYILYLSRIEPRKNHLFLLKAFTELKLYEKGLNLLIVGNPALPTPELAEYFASLDDEIKSRIFFDPGIVNDDLIQLYRAARIVVYPSKAEGFGIPPLEAAAAKLPVICSNTTGMNEFNFFGENHIDPYNYEQFRERLKLMVEHPPSPETLSVISKTVADKYNWEEPAEKFYNMIIGGSMGY